MADWLNICCTSSQLKCGFIKLCFAFLPHLKFWYIGFLKTFPRLSCLQVTPRGDGRLPHKISEWCLCDSSKGPLKMLPLSVFFSQCETLKWLQWVDKIGQYQCAKHYKVFLLMLLLTFMVVFVSGISNHCHVVVFHCIICDIHWKWTQRKKSQIKTEDLDIVGIMGFK